MALFDERIYMHVIGHIKITRTRRIKMALFDERIYMHVIGHIKITRTRRRVALFDGIVLMKGFDMHLLDILR